LWTAMFMYSSRYTGARVATPPGGQRLGARNVPLPAYHCPFGITPLGEAFVALENGMTQVNGG
jgi:hypothetical protein